jgi:uncharacterized membrane protein YgdD (TMEM256/DUF423 family)
MRLGSINGLVALLVLLLTDEHADSMRLGAQVQFMHGMATLACATFMNIGVSGAGPAPTFFLGGILLYCLPTYAEAIGILGLAAFISPIGLSALITGWIILVWSAKDIDRS